MLFRTTGQQVGLVHDWNKRFDWRIDAQCFKEVERTAPAWPFADSGEGMSEERIRNRHVVPVLVPYLVNPSERGWDLKYTIDQLWRRAESGQAHSWHWNEAARMNPARLRLIDPSNFRPGLRWEMIDLGSHRCHKPEDVLDPKLSPHVGIFAAAALHPDWVQAMNGTDVPYVTIPGFKVDTGGPVRWAATLGLKFMRRTREMVLTHRPCDKADFYWATPTLRSPDDASYAHAA